MAPVTCREPQDKGGLYRDPFIRLERDQEMVTMEVSWIVATHDTRVLAENLLATLPPRSVLSELRDELIIMHHQPSLTWAYHRGQELATGKVHCYIQHDVQILDFPKLRQALMDATVGAGMAGIIGGVALTMPWWACATQWCGSVRDPRVPTGQHPAQGDWGPGRGPLVLDGLLLATRQEVAWDTDWPGWHGYDHDACKQMIARGLDNVCVAGGKDMVLHNTKTGFGVTWTPEWAESVNYYQAKWGAGS